MSSFSQPPPPTTQDVSVCATTPTLHSIYSAFIKDEWCHIQQEFFRKNPCAASETSRDLLFTGKSPRVGQLLQIQVAPNENGLWGRLTGLVTEVEAPPADGARADDGITSYENWEGVCKCGCGKPYCRERVIAEFGALHGQIIHGRAVVNFDFHKRDLAPLNNSTVYDVTLCLNDNLQCMWQMVGCSAVPGLDAGSWSKAFLGWGRPCECCHCKK